MGVVYVIEKNVTKDDLGSVTLNDSCSTDSATSTRVTLGSSVAGVRASSTLVTCSAGSTEKLSLLFANEASSTATVTRVTYAVFSSQDRIDFYLINSGTLTLLGDTASSTVYEQVTIDPFIGNWFQVVANANATTSSNLKAVTAELIAR